MAEIPEYYPGVSRHLYHILETLGVSERMRKCRKKGFQQMDVFRTLGRQVQDLDTTVHFCGSQVECATTPGLESDLDILYCLNDFHILQSLQHWTPGSKKFLMVDDETTHSGYVKLQLLFRNAPKPVYRVSNNWLQTDHHGRSLLTSNFSPSSPQFTTEGPAQSTPARLGLLANDHVICLPCHNFPFQAYPWITRHRHHGWPSEESVQKIIHYGCLVVPVGHRCSERPDLEWRLSFSLAERDLMHSLNITQLQCYVLLKLIKAAFIKPIIGDVFSSYHCKTCMFYMLENTPRSLWCPENLLLVLTKCLKLLYNWVDYGHCPQFFIPDNNLFKPKVTGQERRQLRGLLRQLISEECRFLTRIETDKLGEQLMAVCIPVPAFGHAPYALVEKSLVNVYINTARKIAFTIRFILHQVNKADIVIWGFISILEYILMSNNRSTCQEIATYVLTNFIKFQIGCHLVTKFPIGQFTVRSSPDVNSCLFHGVSCDLTSCRLKFASIILIHGNYHQAEQVLDHLVDSYKYWVIPVCACLNYYDLINLAFEEKVTSEDPSTVRLVQEFSAFCVIYLPSEAAIAPQALQYEMFRSVGAEPGSRKDLDYWFDWMVIDSITYMYYLQYLLSSALGRTIQQRVALQNLAWAIKHKANLGHRETALNLLGHCCMRERWIQQAYRIWSRSIRISLRNRRYHPVTVNLHHHNAAKWHLAVLLKRILMKQVYGH